MNKKVELFLALEQVQHSQVMTARQAVGRLCLRDFFCLSSTYCVGSVFMSQFKSPTIESGLLQGDLPPAGWMHRHLLDLEELSAEEITLILDTARLCKEATQGCRKKIDVLSGA